MKRYFFLFLTCSSLVFAIGKGEYPMAIQERVSEMRRHPSHITESEKSATPIVLPQMKEPCGFINGLENYQPAREIPSEIEAKTISYQVNEFPTYLWGVDVAIDTHYLTAYDVDYDMTTGWLYAAIGWYDSTVRIFRSTDNGLHWGYFQGFVHTPKSLYWNIGLVFGRGDSNWLYLFVRHNINNGDIYLFRVRPDNPGVWSHHAVATGADTIDDFSVCRDYRSNYGLYCLWANERRGDDNGRFLRSFDYGKTWDSQSYYNLWDLHISPGATRFLNFTGAFATPLGERNRVFYEWNRNYGAPGNWGGDAIVSFDTFNHYWPKVASVLTTPDSLATTWVLYEYNWRNTGDYDIWYAVRSHAWGDTWRRRRNFAASTLLDELCPDIKHYKLANYPWVCATYTAADSAWDDSVNVYWTFAHKDSPTTWEELTRVNDSLWSEGGWVGSRVIWTPAGPSVGGAIFSRGGLFLLPHGLYMDAPFFTGVSDKGNKANALRISSNPARGQVKFYPISEAKSLRIYDASGKLVKSFTNPKGRILWNGRNEKGRFVSSGIYIIKIATENGEISEKLLFLR